MNDHPEDLGAAGAALWRDLFTPLEDGAVLTMRPHELALLTELCRLVDDVEAIRAALVDQALLAEGSKGQPVVSPLRTELLRTVTRMESLARTLNLPDPDDVGASAGRSLARARWSA